MEYFFSTSVPPEHPFVLFGLSHLLLIAWVFIVGFVIIRMGMKGDSTRRTQLRWLLIALLVVWLIEWQVWHLIAGTWSLQENLPLHMCGIMMLVSIYGLWTRSRFLLALMYFFGIAGAVQAILTPDAIYAFPHFRFMNTWFSHSLLVIAGFWIVFVEGYRPVLKDVWQALIVLHIYAVPVYLLNRVIGSDYLYMGRKPATTSLMDYFPEWPWYFFILQAMVIVVMLGMYLPFRNANNRDAAPVLVD